MEELRILKGRLWKIYLKLGWGFGLCWMIYEIEGITNDTLLEKAGLEESKRNLQDSIWSVQICEQMRISMAIWDLSWYIRKGLYANELAKI